MTQITYIIERCEIGSSEGWYPVTEPTTNKFKMQNMLKRVRQSATIFTYRLVRIDPSKEFSHTVIQ